MSEKETNIPRGFNRQNLPDLQENKGMKKENTKEQFIPITSTPKSYTV